MPSEPKMQVHDRYVSHSLTIAPRDDASLTIHAYLRAKRAVVDHGFSDEILWQSTRAEQQVTHETFFREACWVVLSAGMAERVVRSRFRRIGIALHEFDPLRVTGDAPASRVAALHVFGHERKVDAIIQIAAIISELSEEQIASSLDDPEDFLRGLPYIGPVTWRHLAKNLGQPVAKHDRHLMRLAACSGAEDVDRLCELIAVSTGDLISVVDIVLWRWQELSRFECGRECHDGITFSSFDEILQAP